MFIIYTKKVNNMTNLGERIKKIRGEMTQKEFSELIGITQRAVINYEVSGRVPRKKILKAICEQLKVCEQWLLTGEGPMYCPDKQGEKMADSRPIEKNLPEQLFDNIDKKNIEPQQNDRQSAVLDYMEKTIALQERIASLLEDKAELQVALERAMMNIERRDMRLRELERENEELRKMRKRASRFCPQSGQDVG